jgi:hypothetical protein
MWMSSIETTKVARLQIYQTSFYNSENSRVRTSAKGIAWLVICSGAEAPLSDKKIREDPLMLAFIV